ncbi:6,7-dimethyl-8-ribityllumazine synthase [Edaphocola aurantiacus]|uniref:6,7-dimethyl-8-ribityllumazine synthase n=1 Tax=Edaphocola aurantiacus TaxID=2601682 RepID=UPI001C98143B|nr:6,7-dimethyl-8-ribityllumazine synthase [Edaphocola aurantiacus]
MALSSDSNTLLDLSEIMHLRNGKVGIVYTEWNDAIINEQIAGAKRIAEQTGNTVSNLVKVPGCFEIPYACKALYEQTVNDADGPNAIIAFGAVIRGGTPHFDYVCKAVTEGILQLNLTLPVPVIFGVLTLDNDAQAWERLGGVHGHKGEEAMIAALKMIAMQNNLQ